MLKKRFLIAATGVAAVFLLAGCSPDVIEHQFHTDVSVDTEYVTLEPTDVENTQRFQTMSSFLEPHGFKFRLSFYTDELDPLQDDVTVDSVSLESLRLWIEKPGRPLCIYKKCETSNMGFHDQLLVVMDHVNVFYNALQQLSEEDWEALYHNASAASNKDKAIYLQSRLVEKEGTYYYESSITTIGNMVPR